MVQEYQPRRFFRNAPNRLLQRYFAARNVLSEVAFSALSETQVEPIYQAWLKLSDDVRKEMEQDFQDIDELATEGGSKAILDEARWHGEDLAEQFASLTGFHEHAFWTFLERPKYWQGALAFHHADTVPFSYWRKRKNVPRKPASVDVSTAEQKCARWRRESVPVRLREKGCEAPAICLSARIETRGVIQSLGLASPSRVVFGVAFVA
jgi:hypothetical protein